MNQLEFINLLFVSTTKVQDQPKTRVLRNGSTVVIQNNGEQFPKDTPIKFEIRTSELCEFETLDNLFKDAGEPDNSILSVTSLFPFDQDDMNVFLEFHQTGKITKEIRDVNDVAVLVDIATFLHYRNSEQLYNAILQVSFGLFYANMLSIDNEKFIDVVKAFFLTNRDKQESIYKQACTIAEKKVQEKNKKQEAIRATTRILLN